MTMQLKKSKKAFKVYAPDDQKVGKVRKTKAGKWVFTGRKLDAESIQMLGWIMKSLQANDALPTGVYKSPTYPQERIGF